MVTGRWIRTEDHSERYAIRRVDGWISRASINVGDHEVSAVRRLVVLDPEDGVQVQRLFSTLAKENVHAISVGYLSLRAALREFANPTPRTEEPQGLGAVVEDAEGYRWVSAVHENRRRWYQPLRGGWVDFADVGATRVLSEGVTP
jgi:hypothetical protein